jgi:hypothetical protein
LSVDSLPFFLSPQCELIPAHSDFRFIKSEHFGAQLAASGARTAYGHTAWADRATLPRRLPRIHQGLAPVRTKTAGGPQSPSSRSPVRDQAMDMTSYLEVSQCTTGEWEQAILQGFKAWHAVLAARGGRIAVDLDQRRIDYLGPAGTDQARSDPSP